MAFSSSRAKAILQSIVVGAIAALLCVGVAVYGPARGYFFENKLIGSIAGAGDFHLLGTLDQRQADSAIFSAEAIVHCKEVGGTYERTVYTDSSGRFSFDDAPCGKMLEVTCISAQNYRGFKSKGKRAVYYGRSKTQLVGPLGGSGGVNIPAFFGYTGYTRADPINMGSIIVYPVPTP